MSTVDWGLARQVAGMVHGRSADYAPLAGDPAATAVEAVAPITAYTGLVPQAPVAPVESVDRAQWTAANLRTMATVIDPLAGRIGDGFGPLSGVVRAIGGAVLGAEVGALAGWLGSRVLGQYDVQLLDPPDGGGLPAPRLLLVIPNVRKAAGELEVDEARLVKWVTVHEVTHAVQFTGVPWLRDHIGGLLRDLLSGLQIKVDSGSGLSLPSREELRDLASAVRRGDLMALTSLTGQGEDIRIKLEAVQATMAMVEGHAELVMDAVGVQLLGDLSDMRAAMDRRRSERPALMAWIERALGFELKLRQYTQGRGFCDEVIARSDVATLHRAFAAPGNLPTLAELADADAWLARVAV